MDYLWSIKTNLILTLVVFFEKGGGISAIEYLNIVEANHFAPCVVINGTLTCDALNIDINHRNKTIKFSESTQLKITKIELINFLMDEIPDFYFRPLANDLLYVKIVSKLPIKIIGNQAFAECRKLIGLEIKGRTSLNVSINFDDVLAPLVIVEDLKLIHLNIGILTENYFKYLINLKSLTIDSSVFKSISTEAFLANKNLVSLSIFDMKNSTDLISVLENWPISSKMSLKSLNIIKCNVKSFPKFSVNFVGNLTQLSLAKNPIESISISEISTLVNLEMLSLASTKLNWYSVPGLRMLKNLKDLILNDIITLVDLPAEIEAMVSLESIYMDMSKFQKISIALPESIKKVSASNLQKPIEITSNFLSKNRKLSILYMIALPMDNIQFLLDNIKVLNSSLVVLSLDDTSLNKNRLMEFLGSLRQLEVLHLNRANIDFMNDDVLFNMSSLRQLMLSGNQLRYETINTYGFQSAMRHLTEIDLSKNQLTHLPACTFHSFRNLNGLNVKGNRLVCDCDILWLQESIKKQNINNADLNFSCHSGPNDGKWFLELVARDLRNCSSKSMDNCNPLKTGLYQISFSVTYKWDLSQLTISKINASGLRFLFDYFIIDVQQSAVSFHSELDKYDMTRSLIELNVPLKISNVEVCLILSRNKVDYKYRYNCQTVSTNLLILQSNISILTGVLTGAGIVVLIVIIVVVVVCRRRKREKKNIYYEASSTAYSEPDDTYKSPEPYTDISNNDYSISYYNTVESVDDTIHELVTLNGPPLRQPMSSKSMENIVTLSKTQSSELKFKYRRRPYISKLISKARSSSNLNDKQRNSQPTNDKDLRMSNINSKSASTLPRQYLDRELPMTPPSAEARACSVDFGPPKPRLSTINIQHLLNNTDEHLKKFSQIVQ